MPPKHDAGTATRHYRAFWQRRCRAAAAEAVLKLQGGNCAVLPKAVHLAGNVALRLYQVRLNSSEPAKDRAVEIGYGILPSYEGNGYMTEAAQGMIRWAFAQQDVDFVEAETDPDNRASQRILEKCGFVPNGKTGEEGLRFVVERPQTT